ncbi:Ankyrin-2 [Symbiodinium microadriaticum]|uniref:Ankyrin-2 n=1 Tax=Symbiodinium microadriaticum TaxID=2951 RepID=A0A1Q9CY49_SYMMI|nr:Ankyrin-2 [Symbiodinium microadriaticum]
MASDVRSLVEGLPDLDLSLTGAGACHPQRWSSAVSFQAMAVTWPQLYRFIPQCHGPGALPIVSYMLPDDYDWATADWLGPEEYNYEVAWQERDDQYSCTELDKKNQRRPLSSNPTFTMFTQYRSKGDRSEPWHSAKVRSLIDAGVNTFLCLQEHGELRRFTPYMAIAQGMHAEKDATKALEFFHCPTPDTTVTSTESVLRKLQEGSVVYVHCWGGHGRTGTMVCAFLTGLEPTANPFSPRAETLTSTMPGSGDAVHAMGIGRRVSRSMTRPRPSQAWLYRRYWNNALCWIHWWTGTRGGRRLPLTLEVTGVAAAALPLHADDLPVESGGRSGLWTLQLENSGRLQMLASAALSTWCLSRDIGTTPSAGSIGGLGHAEAGRRLPLTLEVTGVAAAALPLHADDLPVESGGRSGLWTLQLENSGRLQMLASAALSTWCLSREAFVLWFRVQDLRLRWNVAPALEAESLGALPAIMDAKRMKVARLLLEANADKDKAEQNGSTPLYIAAENGQLEAARLLLEAKADKDKAVEDGTTPLHMAAQNGQLEVARLLLEANADKDKAKQSGTTPLSLAAHTGQLEVARLLLEAKADKDKAKQNGSTPLFVAAQTGQLEVARLLLEAKADKEQTLEGGATPVYIAAQKGQLEVARLLLEAKADKDKAGEDGTTPLYIAAQNGQLEVARLLLEANADKDKAKLNGTTPLFVAAHTGQLEVARLLLEAKADKEKTLGGGSTALTSYIAAQKGCIGMEMLCKEHDDDEDADEDDDEDDDDDDGDDGDNAVAVKVLGVVQAEEQQLPFRCKREQGCPLQSFPRQIWIRLHLWTLNLGTCSPAWATLFQSVAAVLDRMKGRGRVPVASAGGCKVSRKMEVREEQFSNVLYRLQTETWPRSMPGISPGLDAWVDRLVAVKLTDRMRLQSSTPQQQLTNGIGLAATGGLAI